MAHVSQETAKIIAKAIGEDLAEQGMVYPVDEREMTGYLFWNDITEAIGIKQALEVVRHAWNMVGETKRDTDNEYKWCVKDEQDGPVQIINADTPQEAAEEYVSGGDYTTQCGFNSLIARTVRVHCRVQHITANQDDKWENIVIEIEPDEPECYNKRKHNWRDNELCGHGGGVIIRNKCSVCGLLRITDTWAQDNATGEQGLYEVRYEREENK